MGKKTKKTRWRTLSIGESDTETPNIKEQTTRNNSKYNRSTNGFWYSNSSNNQKYSNQSTPVKYNHNHGENTKLNHHQYQQQRYDKYEKHEKYDKYEKNGHYNKDASKSTTRSSSTVSENKIKFNEDEYTRITTPRQDVLFKKGYLSKPKPYLQQHHQQQQQLLTSTGNSTGDGTPDHQSADGNDIIDGDYEQSPFIFPSNPNFVPDGGMFFVNGFEPYAVPPHHVLLYDQYGHTVMCLPPPPQQQPPPPAVQSTSGAKRYSLDSIETTSPNNEDAASNTTGTNQEEDEPEIDSTTRIRKKRRRKKTAENTEKLEDISSDELSSLSGDEKHCEAADEVSSSSNSCKYRVDAEEFVPRCYRQQPQPMEYVPLPVGMPLFVPAMYPLTNHQIYYNNPHHFEAPSTSTTNTTNTTTNAADKNEATTSTNTNPNTNGIDIAKIVSKLEQAAKEQEDQLEQEQDQEDPKQPEIVKEDKIEEETNKTESVPLIKQEEQLKQQKPEEKQIVDEHVETKSSSTTTTIPTIPTIPSIPSIQENVRYSERLKQTKVTPVQQQQPQQQQQSKTSSSKQQQQQRRPQQQQQQQHCPRLERQAKPKPFANQNNTKLRVDTTISTPSTSSPSTPSTPPITNPSNNQWISVSGKKKRGKNKQLFSSLSIEEPELIPEELVEIKPPETEITTTIEPEIKPEVKTEVKPEVKPEVKTEVKPEVKEEPQKEVEIKPIVVKSNQSNKKGLNKKRIIINDDLIVNNPNIPKTPSTLKPVEDVKPQEKDNKKDDTVVPQTKPKKKSKKPKQTKPKPSECNNNIDKTSPIVVEQNETDNDQNVSLELDRMIQRGLYGNLEERIRSFNPTDTFIVDVIKQTQGQVQDTAATAAAAAAANFIGVLKKPATYLSGINPVVNNGFLPPKVIINKSPEVDEESRFPITRAVREWMTKTRENTPEVEIFKKPNEIRQEFQQLEDKEVNDEVVDDLDEMSPPSEYDEADLMDYWEAEITTITEQQQQQHHLQQQQHPQQQHVQQIETGVDVLEYESVYGRSEDFARIQREVLLEQQQHQQQQQQQRTSNYNLRVNGVNGAGGGLDGALPYRAICCSIM